MKKKIKLALAVLLVMSCNASVFAATSNDSPKNSLITPVIQDPKMGQQTAPKIDLNAVVFDPNEIL